MAGTLNLLTQARKALADRSPFIAADEDPSKPTTLPSTLAALLSTRRHKKSQPLWDDTEAYFRPITVADIDLLDSFLDKNPHFLDVKNVVKPQKDEEKEADDEDESSSMNWLLGSKFRAVLPSLQPNKKRKLLGADAGLDQLLRLPYPNAGAPDPCCDVCCLGPSGMAANQFLHCDFCKVSVHQRCYGVRDLPTGAWLCSWCKKFQVSRDSRRACVLCPNKGGALKPVGDDPASFAHLFCSMWTPEVYVEDIGRMEPVLNVGGVSVKQRRWRCSVCKVKNGVCARCCDGMCRTSFHPLCARKNKHQMEIWGKFGIDNVELRAFCSNHSSSCDITPVAKPPPVPLPTNKPPKLTLRPGNFRYKSTTEDETRSPEEVKTGKTLERDPLSIKLRFKDDEAQVVEDIDSDGVDGSGNSTTNSLHPSIILRKLIDRGKVNIDDVASYIRISSDSLEEALLGEITSFPSGLKLKLVTWFNDFAHISNIRSGSSIPSANAAVKQNVDDVKGEVNDGKSSHDQGRCNEGIELLEMNSKGTAKSIKSNRSLDIPPGLKAKAKFEGVLELSPEDELEGEILYYQTRLLDKAAAINRIHEDLIPQVVRNLPQELYALNKQRWDMVLVTPYLRKVREAKKQGVRERRHKKAQDSLDAANAAVATSSRNLLLRKDANDGTNSSSQECPVKVTTGRGRGRPSSVLTLRAIESSQIAMPKESKDAFRAKTLSCDICRRGLNPIFVCSCCKVAVHLDCYRRLENPILLWKCELCREMASPSRNLRNEAVDAHCGLCDGAVGAFRKSVDGQWVHAFCAEWLLESMYKRGQENPIDGMNKISKEKNLRYCCVCHLNVGVCLKCSYGYCQVTFHPCCARSASFYMNVKSINGRLQHMAYCEMHTSKQREQDGAEELKTIKQIRVTLEKVRLLCERVVKREKLKRDLVLGSHEILALKRDDAFSGIVRSSLPGVSSDSVATTSASGAIQRSDDITVDGTDSAGRRVAISFRGDVERNTGDSSASRQSFNPMFSLADKHLPRRPMLSVAVQSPVEDGEKLSKERKPRETFPKELLMTSGQASVQNQRLPKGFVYVPVDSLSEEKLDVPDQEPREPPEPGGQNQ